MNNYYVTHKAGYLKQLEALERSVRDVSARYIARDGIDPIMKGAGRDFERFLPQLPYIGGKANRLIKNLIGASYKMKLFPHLEKEGLTIKEIGKLNYEINYEFFNKIPRYKKWLFKHFVMTAGNYKKGAARSQQRRYPGDWVYEYVEGDGTHYDFGVNYTECGIVKIYRQYGMEHYLPDICLGDYATFGALGIELHRTQTLGNGGTMCDFQYKKNGTPLNGWPPDALPEFTGR